MTKILLFGKSGQLGGALLPSLARLGEIVAPSRHEPGGDLCDRAAQRELVLRISPDIVVNAAAFTDVDGAQTQAELATAINGDAPANLARACNETGAWLVHYSSEYVFDGSGSRPWRELDPCVPLNVYGESKLQGDGAIAHACPRHLIIRTSWLYGTGEDNFLARILRKLRHGEPITVVNDQIGAPTPAAWLADVTSLMLRQALSQPGLAGLYHACAGGETSWHAYACLVAEQSARLGLLRNASILEIAASDSETLVRPARRPLNSRLNTAKLQQAFKLQVPDWQAGIVRMLEDMA